MRSSPATQLPARLTGIRIRQLQLFQTLTEVESISEAARRCHITQPAATEMLKELEKAFAAQLFVRGSRGVTLTPEGESFARRVPLIMSELQSIVGGIERARQRRESIRIGFISVAMDSGLPRLVSRMQKSRVKSCVALKELNVSECRNALLSGEIDAAITINQTEFDSHDDADEFQIAALSEERYEIAAPVELAEALGSSPTLDDLRQHLWVLPSRESFLRRAFDDGFLQQGSLPPEAIVELSPVALASRMLVELNASALVSHRTSPEQLQALGLRLVNCPDLRITLRLVLVCRVGSANSKLLAELKASALDIFAGPNR